MKTIRIGALSISLAALIGAFATHSLKSNVPIEDLNVFETANKYHFYIGFSMLFCGIFELIALPIRHKLFKNLILTSLICFCIPLYILGLRSYFEQNINFLGAIAPIGGLSLILGWSSLLLPKK